MPKLVDCIAAFNDMEAMRHVVRLYNATSLYDAAAKAVKTYRDFSRRYPGVNDPFEITITYRLTAAELESWTRSKPETEEKNRIREILEGKRKL